MAVFINVNGVLKKKSPLKYGNKPYAQRGHVLPAKLDSRTAWHSHSRLTTSDVLYITGISHSGMYAKIKAGSFPKPDFKVKQNRWEFQTIQDWLEQNNPARAAVILAEIAAQSKAWKEKQAQYSMANNIALPDSPHSCNAVVGELMGNSSPVSDEAVAVQ